MYEYYSGAQNDLINKGWHRGSFYGSEGEQCIVASLLTAMKMDGNELPVPVVLELQRRLWRYPTFTVPRVLLIFNDSATRIQKTQVAIEYWNDIWWRRKSKVVKVLGSLAKKNEREWLLSERGKLTLEVAQLKEQKEILEQRIVRLEAKNERLMGKLFSKSSIEDDKATLLSLDAELDNATAELV